MRLLERKDNSDDLTLVEFVDDSIPRYAILSHTWGLDQEEVTYADMLNGTAKSKIGYRKIQFCSDQAIKDHLRYVWVDTCCIDKSSSAELSEAINSMFSWYRNASICYVYLSDVSIINYRMHSACIRHSRWFTRGWTLQELIAPTCLEFFSMECERIGDRDKHMRTIVQTTGIPAAALKGTSLLLFRVKERLSWAKGRSTKRQEDAAYSLLGILDVHLPLIYGEGHTRALSRILEATTEHEKRSCSRTFRYVRDYWPSFLVRV
jgi:hypothetical protein